MICMWCVAGDRKINEHINDYDYIPSQCLERAKKEGIINRLSICKINHLIEKERAQFNETHQSCTDTGLEKNMYVCHTLAKYEKYKLEAREGYLRLYETIRATGGTGIFSTLEIFDYSFSTNTLRYVGQVEMIRGDRCNDGWAKVHYLGSDVLLASTSATLFRLLNPLDQTNWRSQDYLGVLENQPMEYGNLFGNLRPYKDLSNCAVCCLGRVYRLIEYSGGEVKNKVTGISLEIPEDFYGQSLVEKCIIKELKSLQNNKPNYWTDDWSERLEEVELKCISRA